MHKGLCSTLCDSDGFVVADKIMPVGKDSVWSFAGKTFDSDVRLETGLLWTSRWIEITQEDFKQYFEKVN